MVWHELRQTRATAIHLPCQRAYNPPPTWNHQDSNNMVTASTVCDREIHQLHITEGRGRFHQASSRVSSPSSQRNERQGEVIERLILCWQLDTPISMSLSILCWMYLYPFDRGPCVPCNPVSEHQNAARKVPCHYTSHSHSAPIPVPMLMSYSQQCNQLTTSHHTSTDTLTTISPKTVLTTISLYDTCLSLHSHPLVFSNNGKLAPRHHPSSFPAIFFAIFTSLSIGNS